MLLWKILLNRWFILAFGAFVMCVGLMPELTMKAVRMFGKMGWAENKVGTGGTYTVWKIIGIIAPILAIMYFFSWYKNVTLFDTPQTSNNTTSSVSQGFGF